MNQEQQLNLDLNAIIYDKRQGKGKETAENIAKILDKKNLKSKLVEINELDKNATFAIVAGGDGTLLKTVRFYSRYEVPVFGINLGRLGFLAQAKAEETELAIEKILNEEYTIEQRLMINAGTEDFCALNDMVIKGESTSRTSRFYLQINNKPVCDYLADGLIISTPTGSTAYTLSAGGPVITPSLEAMVIVPICPHSLTARPLVVPSEEILTIKTKEDKSLQIIADGQKTLTSNKEVVVKKHLNKANLLLLKSEDNGFYSVLREKLHWGVSPKG